MINFLFQTKKKMVEEFFNMSLLGIVPILEAMDDWEGVEKLLSFYPKNENIKIHLEKWYTEKKNLYYYSGEICSEAWYLNDQRHRIDGYHESSHSDDSKSTPGPAFIFYRNNGFLFFESWYLGGQRHKIDGPADIEYREDGSIMKELWCLNNKRHRIDGPAVILYREDGSIEKEEYWINDERQSKQIKDNND